MNASVIAAMIRIRLLRVFRDPSNLIWLFVMPMVFSFLMANLMGDWGSSGTSKPRFVVYDDDRGVAADRLLVPLLDHEMFLLVRADSTVSVDRARQRVDDGYITAALFIPAGFSESAAMGQKAELELFYNSNRLSSQTVRTLLDESLLTVNTLTSAYTLVSQPDSLGNIPVGHSTSLDEAVFQKHWSEPRVNLKVSSLGRLEKKEFALTKAAQHVGPSYTLFFVMMFLMMSAKDLVTERKDRTLARLVVSRATSADLVMGFFFGGFILGLLQAAILLGLNMLPFFGVDYGDSPAGLILVVVLFGGFCSAASVLLGSLARSGPQADGLGMAFTMVLASLGGLWWPLEIVPDFMQKLGHSLPSGQAISVFHDLIGRGYGVSEISHWLVGLAFWFVGTLLVA
ncbi:MAG: ABC transporter permease, partial [bacterium]|nr:ABC transporter permease [bacterium]